MHTIVLLGGLSGIAAAVVGAAFWTHVTLRRYIAEHCDILNRVYGGDWWYDKSDKYFKDFMTDRQCQLDSPFNEDWSNN